MDRKRTVTWGVALATVLAAVAIFGWPEIVTFREETEMTKFDWIADESAPKNYPIKILKGDLIFADGRSLYIPDEKFVHNGWGKGFSTHVVGPDLKPVPVKLSVTWFSYAENKFYSGTWDLPHDKMLYMFRNKPLARYNRRETYHYITTGLAPEGHVSVWMGVGGVTVEIGQYQAQEVDIPWSEMYPESDTPRDELVRLFMEDTYTPEQLERLEREGIPPRLYARYGTKYKWDTEINVYYDIVSVWTNYLNGERSLYQYPMEEPPPSHRAPPLDITISWMADDGRPLGPTVRFDPDEILKAFEKMSGGDTDRPMRLRIDINEDLTAATAFLYVDNLVLQLEKVTLDW